MVNASGNVNLGLKYLSIDDVIRRAAINSGVSKEDAERDSDNLRSRYGRRVFGGEVVLVRPDLNVPFVTQNGRHVITDTERIEVAVPTIRELSDYGAKVVVMAHQGRPFQQDFISLEPHRKVLEDLLEKDVFFGRNLFYGTEALRTIGSMRRGDIFLLDNIRMLSADTPLPKEPDGMIVPKEIADMLDQFPKILGGLIAYFVNDGFSVSHRWNGSVIGFPYNLNIAGRSMEKEIIANRALSADTPRPYTMLLGGIKITDYLELVDQSLSSESVDYVLAAGALGIIGVLGVVGRDKTNYLGRNTVSFLQGRGIYKHLNEVTGLARRYPDRFILPLDFKVEADGQISVMTPEQINAHPGKNRMNLYGIGPQTVARFKEVMEQSQTVYIKGSPTKDDDPRFLPESRALIDTMAYLTHNGVVTILCGGDTIALAGKTGHDLDKDFTSRTLAGGAAAQFKAGKQILPGLYMLHISYNALNGKPLGDGLGGYNLGFDHTAPRIPELLKPR